MQKDYEIDEETMEMCKALEFYDENLHFPWEKKKVLITISYKSLQYLKNKNRSKIIDNLIKLNYK